MPDRRLPDPSGPDRVVVGAAVVRDGRVLAAHRPGRGWELPGGKVEPGEGAQAALVREIDEELGCRVEVVDWLPGESAVAERLVLRVAVVRLVGGTPVAGEHDDLRWVGPDELDAMDWLAPDRPFLPGVREALAGPG